MTSQSLEQLNSQNLEQLRNEIEPILLEALTNSKLGETFQKYGISASEAVEVELKLDTTKLSSSKTLQALNPQDIVIWCSQLVRPCPDDGRPEGCWQRKEC